MATFWSVEDSDGERHIVAADDAGSAVAAVKGHLNKGDYSSNADSAQAVQLGPDLVPSGTVLSGVSAAEQEKRQNQRNQGYGE
jgi:hypothetical protein